MAKRPTEGVVQVGGAALLHYDNSVTAAAMFSFPCVSGAAKVAAGSWHHMRKIDARPLSPIHSPHVHYHNACAGRLQHAGALAATLICGRASPLTLHAESEFDPAPELEPFIRIRR